MGCSISIGRLKMIQRSSVSRLNPIDFKYRLNCRFSRHFMTVRFLPRALPLPVLPSLLRSSLRMSTISPESTFQLKVNPITGETEWIVIDAARDEESTSLLAATSYLDMLNDSSRNEAFHQAIRKTITRPCRVLDIGAGTGLLSMMAAEAMAESGGDEGIVYACESYLPMGKLMRKVLQANRLKTKVKLFHKRSDELRVGSDLPCPADVVVSEILDSELLGEGLIPSLQHAYDMLLVKHPKSVPYRATIYGQLVESEFLHKLHDLPTSEIIARNGMRLAPEGLESFIRVNPKQYAMRCDALSDELKLLSEPFKVFDFELWHRPESHRESNINIKATASGTVHAVISWWVLQLDDEGSIFYSTAPLWVGSHKVSNEERSITDKKVWCDHWRQCVWFTHGTGIPLSNEEEITFQSSHDEISISYCFENDTRASSFSNSECRMAETKLILSPERIGIYGDSIWRSAILKALGNQIRKKSAPVCVIADDSIFLTLAAAQLSEGSHIISMLPGLRGLGSRYLDAVSHLNGISRDRIRVIGNKAASLTSDDLSGRKIDLLLAEPFYCGSEAMLPWQALRFWREKNVLNSFLSEDALIVPSKGILKCCAMSLPDLWNSRRSLGKIEGFDHSIVNDVLGACGDLSPGKESPCLPYSIWQCGETEWLSDPFPITEFNFSGCMQPCSWKVKVKFNRQGVCHGFVLWMDWVLDDENSIAISSGPDNRLWKQGVKLLNKPVQVNAGQTFSDALEACFDPSNGEILVRCSL
ncbi:protein arginine methyltransferase 7 [Wolffia australiana]